MNQLMTGEFIQNLRKEKGMTQKDLAEKIGVSDKTISKWETGGSLPDITYLEPLCENLEISVNELLSAEKLPPHQYSEKAEENIMSLLKENQSRKRTEMVYIIVGLLFLAASIVCIGASMYGPNKINIIHYIDLPSLIIPTVICLAAMFLSGKKTKLESVVFLRRIVIPVGALTALISIVYILTSLDSLEYLGPNLAVSVLALVYTVTAYIVLCIIEKRMTKQNENM